ncbi:MAG TPA: hypothetical protein VM513_30205 [Kofleriaceae bacterium]|nr:hypothetical protein [Kofleriaceae bacterium]
MAGTNRHVALVIAVVAAGSEAHAKDCSPPSPECHLANGKELLESDPKRAAEELLASFKLDERTDTLELYAMALQADRKYALSLETWKRVIVFRESELDAAREAARKASGRKATAAKAALARSQKQNEAAAEAIQKLWGAVGRVRVKIAAGEVVTVSRGGIEVDATRDVTVNAGRDELVLTRKDGRSKRIVVEVAPGGVAEVEAVFDAEPSKAEPMPAQPPKGMPKLPAEPLEEPEPMASTQMWVETPRSPRLSKVGLGIAAGGLVSLAVAGTFGYLAERDYDDARSAGCNDAGQCPVGQAVELAEQSNDRARVAQITAIGGGALLVTGAVMWVVGRGKTRHAAPAVTVHVQPSSAAIAWRF